MWGKLQPSDDGEARVRELIQTGKFWGGMIGRGADHERYDGTREDAIRIVKMILDNAHCKLHIHEEHDNGKRLADTAAGQEVTDRLDILKAQHTGERHPRQASPDVNKSEDKGEVEDLQQADEGCLQVSTEVCGE